MMSLKDQIPRVSIKRGCCAPDRRRTGKFPRTILCLLSLAFSFPLSTEARSEQYIYPHRTFDTPTYLLTCISKISTSICACCRNQWNRGSILAQYLGGHLSAQVYVQELSWGAQKRPQSRDHQISIADCEYHQASQSNTRTTISFTNFKRGDSSTPDGSMSDKLTHELAMLNLGSSTPLVSIKSDLTPACELRGPWALGL